MRRFAGSGRLETAIEVSRGQFPDGRAQTVVLARADEYPDALAGAPVAVRRGGPLLITPTDELAPQVTAEITRVLPPGSTVHLLGGEAALGAAVESAVRALGYEAVRLAGDSRIETALVVAESLGALDDVLLTTGFDFPARWRRGPRRVPAPVRCC